MAKFRIALQDLSGVPKAYDFRVPVDWLKKELEETDLSVPDSAEDGIVELEATLSGTDVLLRGRVRATLAAECARCLAAVALELDADMTNLLTASGDGHRPTPDHDELTPEDLEREFYAGDEIILDTLIRENLILEVPMQVHCGHEACRERWESSGESAVKDSPFAALAKLKS